jgi:hypothetical protein
MPPINPDLAWYAAISERKSLPGRCPYALVQKCPRYFDSLALLSDEGITAAMPNVIHDAMLAKWKHHELAPATAESATSISGPKKAPSCYSNFCPEVAFDTFRLFGTTLIRLSSDPVDRQIAEQVIAKDPSTNGIDWRWMWSHVEPLHYSDCPLYANLFQEKSMSSITFNAPVTGNINVAGQSIHSPVMSLSLGELLRKVESSNATPAEKEAAKSKLAEFLSHPLITAIVGGLVGKIGS